MLSVTRAMVISKIKKNLIFPKSRMLHISLNHSNNSNHLTQSQISKNRFVDENSAKSKSELQDKFTIYMKNLIMSVVSEKETIVARERLLNSNLPQYLQE